MLKKTITALALFLFAIFSVHSTALAAFQMGVGAQLENQQLIRDTTDINWWFTDHLALHGDYSWNDGDLDLAALYKINPQSSTAFYIGLAENDLSGKVLPGSSLEPKTSFIAGMEWNLFRINSGLSLTIEAGISPMALDQSGENSGPVTRLGISLNYRFPPININGKRHDHDANLLAKLITLEAPDEPFEGQVAVAAVVLNRIRSTEFPNSVQDVIYQPGQFSTARKLAETTPSESALKAAKTALRGSDPSYGALFFYNPATCSLKARQYIKKAHYQVTARIGNHVFLK